MNWLLWAVVLLPLLGAFAIIEIPREDEESASTTAFFWSLCTFFASLPLFFLYDHTGPVFQLVSQHAWLPAIGSTFQVGVDGISLLLILLSTFLVPIVVL